MIWHKKTNSTINNQTLIITSDCYTVCGRMEITMRTNKDFIRQVIWSAVISNPDNENCSTKDITDDIDFVSKYEIPSIQVVAIVAQLEEEYEIELKLSDIYRLRSVNEIAEYIEQSTSSVVTTITETTLEKEIDDLFSEL